MSHEWEHDPGSDEGMRCANCGVSEAELDRYPGECDS